MSRAAATVVAFALLMTTAVGPAHADPGDMAADPVVIDAGNGVAVVVDPELRLLSITTPTPLSFHSLLAGEFSNSYFWGTGWGYGNVSVGDGGRFTFPQLGTYEYDPTSPTRLRDYPKDDVVASVEPGHLPPRGEVVPALDYQASLYHRDTRTTDYFDGGGVLIVSITEGGGRTDWEYRLDVDEVPRLLRIRHADDSVTQIDCISDRYYRIAAPGGVVRLLQTLELGGSESPYRFFGDREYTEFVYASPSGQGPLVSVQTINPSTGDQTVIEIEWDLFAPERVARVLKDGQVVFPIS
ncbi:hypothetical protein [Agromyces silvae]|uniref:hypothetical protein n=1 Tax=Agromyces silvae TaxID=3388266 RepID=UPI00280BF07B|nr:hypothetical protein [Agromyces protaetiae]